MINEAPELQMYRNTFRLMLAMNSNRVLQNDSISHAVVLIEELIRHAQKEVYVYCTRLADGVWGTSAILSGVREAVGRGVVFHVLTRLEPDEHSLAKREFENLGICIDRGNNEEVKENFIVVDGKAFRFESDPDGRKGVACANSPINAQLLINMFHRLNSNPSAKDKSNDGDGAHD